MHDVIVVGGGIVGMSTAYHLGLAGARTLLIDRDDPGRATNAGAGILSPETNSRDPEAWFDFAVAAVAYYPTLMQHLQADQSGETGYARCGQLVVAVSEDEQAPFERARRLVLGRQERRGQPSTTDLYELPGHEAQALFPPLAPLYGALYYRNAARVDGRLLTGALRQAALHRGVSIWQGSVEQLAMHNRQVTGVVLNGTTLPAGNVVIAGGAWSSVFGAQLGLDIPITPQRGQIIHLSLPGTDTSTWPMISAFHGHYMVPWQDSRVVVGATRETGSGFHPQTTAAGVQEVLREALRVAPGLAAADIRDIRVGLRPYTIDTMPVLGPVPDVSHVLLATGHGPTGLTLGPYSGKVIAEAALGQTPSTEVSAFEVARFRDGRTFVGGQH
ncbi:MAG: NAD(P)/FAD-dependent oxidoreductase [Candidatus Tectimicrobiota bacterium]